ncbi:hypothetical protein ARSEF4850_006835 [Beauveria asiatica]
MLFKSSYPDIHVPPDLTLWQWLFDAPSPAAGCSSSRGDSLLPTREYINTAAAAATNNNTRLTHAQVRDAAAALSAALAHPRHRHRLRPGDVVMCAPGETLKMVREAARKEGVSEERVFWFADDDEEDDDEDMEQGGRWCTGLSELVHQGKRLMEEDEDEGGMRAVGLPSGKTSAETTAFLCFSSGTTGLPKACLQLNLAYTHSGMARSTPILPQYKPPPSLPLPPFLLASTLPIANISPPPPRLPVSGLVRSLVHCLVSNTSIAVVPRFTMPALLSAISTHRVAEVSVVPPILIRLAHDPAVDDYDLGCVERWAAGAAPGYGMTETTACVTTHPPHLYGFEHGRSVGTLVAGTVMKVVNEDGVAIGVGERGEIRVKGPQIVPGYFDNPAATAAAFDPDGFLRTGDEGSVAPDGQLTIHDRIKEMIKVKGAQVAPAELEDLLLGHPCVADAAVVGVPDEYAGARPFAFVVLRPGPAVAPDEAPRRLVQHVKDARARDKWLAGVRVVEAIPKSPSGKILRRILRDEYKKSVDVSSAKL